MGLLDRIVTKAVRTAGNAIGDAVGDTVGQKIKDNLGIKSTGSSSAHSHSARSSATSREVHSIPAAYSDFPEFPGEMSGQPRETKTDKYTRLTLNYTSGDSAAYKKTLLASGFSQGSAVRYDKGKTYVIVEASGSGTKIAYQINK